jgi:beta-glucanase (GH16 family)
VLQEGTLTPSSGTDFKSTKCDYQLTSAPTQSPTPSPTSTSTSAAVLNGWGTLNTTYSDEYNGTSIDLSKWALFGTDPGQSTGCAPGHSGNGQRCGSQDTEGGGYLTVTSTANGVTGGLSGRHDFTYGRIEVRERAYPTASNGGHAYHAVPLLWPQNDDYTHGEIDFAERDVADPSVTLFVHHDGTQTSHSTTINSQEFHNYAIEWQPTFVKWYVDGVQVGSTVNASISMSHFSNGGAQMDMFSPTGTLMRPAKQDVDWIRMYPIPGVTTYQ